MKITEFNGADAASAANRTQDTQKTGRTGASQSGAANGAQSGDRVEFSSGLGQLSRAISSYGADRSRQVQSLAALYQSGNYHPDSAATSRSMISDALGSGAAS